MRYHFTKTKEPIRTELKANQHYSFCRCGKSDHQPLCDRYSHHGTSTSPISFSVIRDGAYYLCGCKRSSHMPYCDGTHKKKES